MAQKNKILLIVASIVAIGSIGYYFFKKSKNESSSGGAKTDPSTDEKEPESKKEPKNATKKPQSKDAPNPNLYMNSFQKVQAFQDWLDNNYPTWLNGGQLNKKGGYGNFGTNTKKAWQNYGSTYIKTLGNKTTTASLKVGDYVSAVVDFQASAKEVRNNVWFSVDVYGKALPQKTFTKGGYLGKVRVVLGNGNIIVELSTPITDPMSGTKYSYIEVKSSWVKLASF
jgi:hypothetical protein